MRFQCPFCRGIVAVENNDLGQNVQCGHCGEIVTVPFSRLATGAVISDFIILEELGRGGMGIVYLAHQISLDRPAAVKILAEHYANNAEFVVNFIKEARAAAKLNHPHIVQAYAVGEDEGIFFFAMEHIDGETMKQVLKREKIITVDQAVTIIQQIAEALDYAWKEARLIHRDIKPDNIMITKNGRAKLADLGLSKVAGEVDDAESDEVMGTPQYISPEHLTGAPMDVRSDIYSLGATFYNLVTGRFPFEGRTPTEIARKHLEEALVPPHMVNPDVPIAVGQVIEKMMAKNIKNRYQDAEQLVEDLRMVRRGKKPPVATQGIKALTGLTKLGLGVSATRKQLETQFKTLNMQIGRMTGKFATGTVSDLDTLAMVELRRQRRKKLVFICAIVLIMVVGLAAFSYSFFNPRKVGDPAGRMKLSKNGNAPNGKTVPDDKAKRIAASAYIRGTKKLMAFHNANPDKNLDFIGRVDDFLEEFPQPRTADEKKEFDDVLAVYVPLDETMRVLPAREKLEEKYHRAVEKAQMDHQRQLEEQRRKAEERRLAEAQRQREDRQRREQEDKRNREARAFVDRMSWTKNDLRGRLVAALVKPDYEQAQQLLGSVKDLRAKLPANPHQNEREAVEGVIKWADQVRPLLEKSRKLYNLVYNSGNALAGLTLEIKTGQLVKIESISGGVVDVKPVMGGDEIDKIKIDDLPAKALRLIIRKALAIVDDEQAEFFFLFARGYFSAKLKEKAPDPAWEKEYSELVKAYLKLELSKSDDARKKELRERYSQVPELKLVDR